MAPAHPSLVRAKDLTEIEHHIDADRLLARPLDYLTGHIVQLSGQAVLSVGFALVRHAQTTDRPAALITATDTLPFVPDLVAAKVDLARLVVIDIQDSGAATRAATTVLRSGQFACVVLEINRKPPIAAFATWMRLCEQHGSVLCVLAPTARQSLASTVWLHIRTEVDYSDDTQRITLHVLRSRGGVRDARIDAYGPAGVR